MDFKTPQELRAHYAAIKQRIAAAARAAQIAMAPPPPPPPIPPEPKPDLRPPLLAGAPVGPIREVIEPILQRHELTWLEISSAKRSNRLVACRHECMWEMRRAGMSYPTIGTLLNRDHTTVIHGVKKYEHTRTA